MGHHRASCRCVSIMKSFCVSITGRSSGMAQVRIVIWMSLMTISRRRSLRIPEDRQIAPIISDLMELDAGYVICEP